MNGTELRRYCFCIHTSTAFSPTDVPVLSRWGKDSDDDSVADLTGGDALLPGVP